MHPLNPNQDCELNCRFTYGFTSTTAMYYPPVYDKHGNNINPDGNITHGTIECLECYKRWAYSTQYGKTKYSEGI
jgi:hypothetical protein